MKYATIGALWEQQLKKITGLTKIMQLTLSLHQYSTSCVGAASNYAGLIHLNYLLITVTPS